ncbi:TPA: hypothetical protein ACS50D_003530 [Salmonella enterica]
MTTKHPAHGPVSLDRLHQISEILSKAAAQSDGGNLGYAMADAVKVIDEAIAAFGAEPVGEVVLGEYDDCGSYPDARVVCIAADGQADWENFKDGTRLYAVNPAQVSIDERAAFNAWNNDENLPIAGVGAKNAAWLAWQARAAMLQSFGNTEQLIKHQSSNQGSDSNASWEEIKQPSSNCIPGVQAFIDAMIQDEDVSLTNEGEMLRFRRNSPVTPDCWVMVPKEITCEMDDAAWDAYHETRSMSDIWAALLAAAPQQEVKP